ncbi:MAG: tRNA threonylcarbamoyladenosine biosynthesis protein TsaE [Pseudomonadota bacterium]
MKARRQPCLQSGLGRGQINARHANLGQSKLTRPDLDLGPEFKKVVLSTFSSHPPIVESPALPPVWELVWADESATQAFATQLAHSLATWVGGRDASIELRGQLGAGKTTLVRHLLRAAGVQGRIKSPTYAVVEPHQAVSESGVWPIWHFDFYRFNDPQEWEDAGFRDIFAGPGLKLMEWPDKVAGQLPPPDWVITLEAIDEDHRRVRIHAPTSKGQAWLLAHMKGAAHGA